MSKDPYKPDWADRAIEVICALVILFLLLGIFGCGGGGDHDEEHGCTDPNAVEPVKEHIPKVKERCP